MGHQELSNGLTSLHTGPLTPSLKPLLVGMSIPIDKAKSLEVLGHVLDILQKEREFHHRHRSSGCGNRRQVVPRYQSLRLLYPWRISGFFSEYTIPSVENMNQEANADNSDSSPIGAPSQQIAVYLDTYNRSYFANAYCNQNMIAEYMWCTRTVSSQKILWADDQDRLVVASSAEYISSNGSTLQVYGDSVIVSAGFLNMTKVLELSGVNSTDVGKNLQNRLGVNVIYKLKEDSGVTLGSETSHFVRTAAAIAQEDGGVVDHTSFIVYGTPNVRVVDASLIPLLPGIHTQSIV
ncbi:hypothetical protein DFS33DRAFT_1384325 [Desarmillaria ectypa]|nr:hypothetical protein DFS33DRAFT_1384325 [Desarmillaria ectypa]